MNDPWSKYISRKRTKKIQVSKVKTEIAKHLKLQETPYVVPCSENSMFASIFLKENKRKCLSRNITTKLKCGDENVAN